MQLRQRSYNITMILQALYLIWCNWGIIHQIFARNHTFFENITIKSIVLNMLQATGHYGLPIHSLGIILCASSCTSCIVCSSSIIHHTHAYVMHCCALVCTMHCVCIMCASCVHCVCVVRASCVHHVCHVCIVHLPLLLLRSNGLNRRLVQYVVFGKNKLKCKY